MIESHVKNMVAEQAEETTVSILANRGYSSLSNIQFILIFNGESLRFKFDKIFLRYSNIFQYEY